MVDELYPSLIVTPSVEDYRLRPPVGGGAERIFADREKSRKSLLKDCETIKARLNARGNGAQAVGIARLKLRDEALAKSHRPREAFTEETCPIIGDLTEAGEFLVLVDPTRLENLTRKVRSLGRRGTAHLTSVESFGLFGIERRFPRRIQDSVEEALKSLGQARLKIRVPSLHLFSSLYREELEHKLLELIGLEAKPYLYQGDFTLYAADVKSMEQALTIASLQFIDRLDLMPTYMATGSLTIDWTNIRLAMGDDALETLPIVAIVDTGIDDKSPLEPLIWGREKIVPPSHYNPAHGTAVAALAAAQDGIVSDAFVPRCRLLDIRAVPNGDPKVGPVETLYEDRLVDRLEEALQKYGGVVKHWNLSLAEDTGDRLETFSDFGMALDNFHKQYKVHFYCAPGNCKDWREWPYASAVSNDWIAAPGDALCGITVGSCAPENAPDNALAPKWAPSPFSPHGPAPSSVIKPDLVEVGGTLGFDGKPIGTWTIRPDGEYETTLVGTSFATPQVSGTGAELAACLERTTGNQFSPLLLSKALLLHHAQIPSVLPPNGNFRLSDFFGFGKPASIAEMMGDPFWRSTALICAQLYPDGEDLIIDDFPFPDGLCIYDAQRSINHFSGHVWITMVSEPILNPSFKLEYARSNVDVHFGVMRQTGEQKEDFVSQVRPDTGMGHENSLIREAHKWSPVKQYHTHRRMWCSGNWWRLRVGLTLRDKEADIARKQPKRVADYKVDVVLAVTVEDPTQTVHVNNEMAIKWRARGYIPTPIGVAPRLRTRFNLEDDNL